MSTKAILFILFCSGLSIFITYRVMLPSQVQEVVVTSNQTDTQGARLLSSYSDKDVPKDADPVQWTKEQAKKDGGNMVYFSGHYPIMVYRK